MARQPTLQALCATLDRLRDKVAGCEPDFGEFIVASDFPAFYKDLELVETELQILGLSDVMWAALWQAEYLILSGNLDKAERILRGAVDDLRDTSGCSY